MLEASVVEVPHSIELLQGLGQKEIDLILAGAKRRRFSAKSVMIYQGEPADHLLLLWKAERVISLKHDSGSEPELTI